LVAVDEKQDTRCKKTQETNKQDDNEKPVGLCHQEQLGMPIYRADGECTNIVNYFPMESSA
jgi:hypothetical protein